MQEGRHATGMFSIITPHTRPTDYRVRVYGCIWEWMDGWMDGWMIGWMDGWMDRWIDGLQLTHPPVQCLPSLHVGGLIHGKRLAETRGHYRELHVVLEKSGSRRWEGRRSG